jgi:diacylglycerol kinase (ATP)
MKQSLVIINPHAGGGKAVKVWDKVQYHLRQTLGDVSVVITRYIQEIPNCLKQASEEGTTRVISVGGDGTNHYIMNAIMQHNACYPDEQLTFATIPAGTGQDWARGIGTPLDPKEAINWVANTRLRPIDIGIASLDGQERYFLNASSVGISNAVVQELERTPKGQALTYPAAIMKCLFRYQPEHIQVSVDGQVIWDNPSHLLGVSNGRYFGQGLMLAPNAQVDDGQLDVVIAPALSKPALVQALAQLPRGAHLNNKRLHFTRTAQIKIFSKTGKPVGLDLDGEGAHASEIVFSVKRHALMVNV